MTTQGTIEVFKISFASIDKPLEEELKKYLSPDEVDRSNKYRFEQHRHRFICTRGFLRWQCGKRLNLKPEKVKFQYGPHGKPSVKDHPRLQFNVSHTDDLSIVALNSHTSLGVDIERIKHDFDFLSIAEHFFAPGEVRALNMVAPAQRAESFFNCWTRKEAFIKTNGDGLSYPLNKFEVSLVPGEIPALLKLEAGGEVNDWTFHELEVTDGYKAALAYQHQPMRIITQSWDKSLS